MKERIITITLSIDEETHEGKITPIVTENGELKENFSQSEMATTLEAIHRTYNMLSQQFINQLGAAEGIWEEE